MRVYLFFSISLYSFSLIAHETLEPEFGPSLNASITAYATNSGLGRNELWQIPGVLVGGHAEGFDQGLTLSDLSVQASYGMESNTELQIEVSSHDGDSPEFEKVTVSQYFDLYNLDTEIGLEIGKARAQFSPFNSHHKQKGQPLLGSIAYDAFLGGELNDLGAKALAKWDMGSAYLFTGIELWYADTFPAGEAREPVFDVFAYYEFKLRQNVSAEVGAWYLKVESSDRYDDRLESGHSHGTATISESRFTGETDILGFNARLVYGYSANLDFLLDAEFILVDIDGTLRDSTYRSTLDSDHRSVLLKLGVKHSSHHVGIQYEWMGLKNALSGPGAASIANTTYLIADEDPIRTTAIYDYGINNDLHVSLNAVYDQTTNDDVGAFFLGISWQNTFLNNL